MGQDVAHLFGHLFLGLANPPDLVGRGAAHALHRLHAVLYVFLLPGQLVHPFARVLQVALETLVLGSAQLVSGVAQPSERGPRFGDTGGSTIRRGPAHGVGGLLELPRYLLQLPLPGLPG